MFKYLLLIVLLLMSCVDKQASAVGGWYPVFFKNLDSQQLNEILKKLNQGACASISYPNEQKSLEQEIDAFFKKNGFELESKISDCTDTATQKCDHDRVIVTVWTKYDSATCRIKKNKE